MAHLFETREHARIRQALADANASIEMNRSKALGLVSDQIKKRDSEKAPGWCESKYLDSQKAMNGLVSTSAFDQIIMAAIGVNTLCLAIVHYNQPQEMTDILDYLEYLFTGLFMVEALMKIVGFGVVKYFTSQADVFDFMITILSFVSLFDIGSGNFSALRTLRVFRALRIARVLRRFPVVMRILKGVLGSVNTIIALGIFLLFVLLLFGVIGMHLYGNRFKFYPKPRANFDTFWYNIVSSPHCCCAPLLLPHPLTAAVPHC